METIFKASLLVPLSFIILEGFIIILIAISLLKIWKILKYPMAGMDYSETIFGAVLIFSFFLVCSGSVEAVFNSYKNYEAQSPQWLMPTLVKFAQISLVNIIFVALLAGLAWLVTNVLFKVKKGAESIANGDIPLALIMSSILLSFSILLRAVVVIVLDDLTPHFVIMN